MNFAKRYVVRGGGGIAFAFLLLTVLFPSKYSIRAWIWQTRFMSAIQHEGRVDLFQISGTYAKRIFVLDMYDYYQGGFKEVFQAAFTDIEWFFWGGRYLGQYWMVIYEIEPAKYQTYWVSEKLVSRGRNLGRRFDGHTANLVLQNPKISQKSECFEQRPCLVRAEQ